MSVLFCLQDCSGSGKGPGACCFENGSEILVL